MQKSSFFDEMEYRRLLDYVEKLYRYY